MSKCRMPPGQKLDKLDKKILAALYRDARITKTRMSEEVGLSSARCAERMQRLEKSSVVRGYHADVDLRLLARLSFFHVQVRLFDTTPAKMRQFEHCVSRIDVVMSCQAVLGTIDYIMTVVAPSTQDFQAIMDGIAAREPGTFDFVTFPVAKTVKSPHSVSLLALMESA